MARPLYKNLTVQVLAAVAVGVTIGHLFPAQGVALKPLSDAFIKLVKMIVGPIIFLTIVAGIASIGDLKKVGRVGGKALLYFEVITTLAMAVGMLVANVVQPGHRAAATPPAATAVAATTPATTQAATQPAASAALAVASPKAPGDQERAEKLAAQAKKQSLVEFLLNVIPKTFVGAFTNDEEILQVLFVAILTGFAIAGLGAHAAPLLAGVERLTEVMFRIVAMIMKVAPLGALGAMAFTIGERGIGSIVSLATLMACVYLTMAVFVFIVLGAVCRLSGVRLLGYLKFIREEILLVLGTSSSESALPRMMEKLELMGCRRSVVGLVIPAGYSFNLDGTSIYLSMAILFITQALGHDLSFGQQVGILGVLLLTSKGAAAVTGGGLITLAATLAHVLPPEQVTVGLALVVGVDRFMSEARAITNLIGNGVATIVVAKWEGEFDRTQYNRAMAGHALTGTVDEGSPEVRADVARDEGAGAATKP
jgi:aerobic C4-dicarboxylate transport protein